MLEVLGEKMLFELWWVPYDKTVVVRAPLDNRIGGCIVNHVIGLAEERRRHVCT